MILLGKLAMGFGTAVLATGALAFQDGIVDIQVEEHQKDGERVHVIVPAAMIPFALNFVPDAALERLPREARRHLPAIQAAAEELRRLPDTVLVEVEDGREHVCVQTRGGRLVIDVDSDRETVHVSVPLRTVESSLRRLKAKTEIEMKD
jgi:hypothetical protein